MHYLPERVGGRQASAVERDILMFVVLTTYGLGPDAINVGPVYGPFETQDDAWYFADRLPDVEGYANQRYSNYYSPHWTNHQVHGLVAPA